MLPTISKPKTLASTLLLYITVALTFSTLCEASDPSLHRRDHVALNRLIKKRAPQGRLDPFFKPAANAGNDPNAGATGTTTGAVTGTGTGTGTATANPGTATTSAGNGGGILGPILDPKPTPTVTTTSTSSSSSTLSTPTLATTPLTLPTTSIEPSKTLVTSTVEADPSPTSAATTSPPSPVSKVLKNIVIVVGASVVGVAIIWTIFRKWKLRKSKSFDERMQPIDWQPTDAGDDGGLPVNRRRTSMASSFHSGAGHDQNMAGHGMGPGQYGGTDYGLGAPSMAPLPDHDFTATHPAHLAPVGGYADLARGGTPQPQMQEAYGHGMTYGHQDAYGHPAQDQYGGHMAPGAPGAPDAYDYNGQAVRY